MGRKLLHILGMLGVMFLILEVAQVISLWMVIMGVESFWFFFPFFVAGHFSTRIVDAMLKHL